MIPSDVETFHTKGEELFYRFLERVAKPDQRFLVWYTPDVMGSEPDFVLYYDEVGLIVFEVKDWLLSQIREADKKTFHIQDGRKLETHHNPIHQARNYFLQICDCIRKDGKLVSRNLDHHGQPKIPISYGVVFPNINKFDYSKQNLYKVVDTEKIFFWDDLHPASDICNDISGGRFRKELQERFPPRFQFQLLPCELNHLRQVLFPVVGIELPERRPTDDYTRQQETLRVLDHHQEAIARKWDGGHRIITGPSGTGKTLVLVHKAALLLRYNPKVRSILFLCYNVTLVNYVKRLLASKGVPLGETRVEVLHFFEFCARLTGEVVQYENQDPSYYDFVLELALDHLDRYAQHYDAILLDEGQDFSDQMLQVMMKLLNPETNHLTIALDDRQDLYHRTQSWKEAGIRARSRVHRLSVVYRNTHEIADFGERFLSRNPTSQDTGTEPLQLTLFPDPMVSQGPKPELVQLASLKEMVSFVADKTRSLSDAHDYPFSEFAVLYATKNPNPDMEQHLPSLIQRALEVRGIISHWASEDYRSKKDYDITTNSVTVCTIHSSKGLDWACVFLLGLDALEPGKRWTEEQIRNLAYVGITRARHQLYILYVQPNFVIRRAMNCL